MVPLPTSGEAPGWWPAGGANTIIDCRAEAGRAMLYTVDLSSNAREGLGPIENVPWGWDTVGPWMPHSFASTTDGRTFCLAGLGVTPEHADTNGPAHRVNEIDLDRRVLQPTEQALIGDGRFERVHTRPRVAGSSPAGPLQLADVLRTQSVVS